MIKAGVASCKATGHIMPFIPLHKGADGFMSDEQFRRFYWPTLRKVIIGLINEGIVPQLFAEGGYNQRLDVISDIPRGKVVWWFDLTDMARAKKMSKPIARTLSMWPARTAGLSFPPEPACRDQRPKM